MDSKSTPPPLGKVLRASADYAARSREGVRAALRDAKAGSLNAPAADEHVRRFLYGFMAPLTLIRVAWANAPIRRSMVRRLLPPLLFIGVCTTFGVIDVVESLAAARGRADRGALAVASDDDDDDDEDESQTAQERGERAVQAAQAREEITKVGAEVREAITRGAREDGRNPNANESSKIDVAATAVSEAAAKIAAAAPEKASRRLRPPPATRTTTRTGPFAVLAAMTKLVKSKLAQLIATLGVIEWILVWIGREHHEVIAHDLAELTGVPSAPAPTPPNLRLDLAWLTVKGWRFIRYFLLDALATPVVWIAGMLPVVGAVLAVLVTSAWFAYWASVFAIANTFLAWEAPLPPEWAPWFLRVVLPLQGIRFIGAPSVSMRARSRS